MTQLTAPLPAISSAPAPVAGSYSPITAKASRTIEPPQGGKILPWPRNPIPDDLPNRSRIAQTHLAGDTATSHQGLRQLYTKTNDPVLALLSLSVQAAENKRPTLSLQLALKALRADPTEPLCYIILFPKLGRAHPQHSIDRSTPQLCVAVAQRVSGGDPEIARKGARRLKLFQARA